jgi:hypothetical protein
MPKRAWCSDCNSYVLLTAEEQCPSGHPRCALRGVEEVSAVSMASAGGTASASSFGPPTAPAIASGATSATWDPETLPRDSRGVPVWAIVAGIVLVVGLGFGIKQMTGPKRGVVHTMNGVVVTVPKGWGVVADKPTQFLVTPDGNDRIAVQVDKIMDATGGLTDSAVDIERTADENAGLRVDRTAWLGHDGIVCRSTSGPVGQVRTMVWDGNASTYRADYNASGSDFDAHLAEANAMIQSMQVVKNQ